MPRKLLTSNQTRILKQLRFNIKSNINRDVTLTDIFEAIFDKRILAAVSSRINSSYKNKENKREVTSRRKLYSVYSGSVLSNGVQYNVIVAAKNKAEVREIIGDTLSVSKWKKSTSAGHADIALTSPGVFFGLMEIARGRPSANNYSKLTNVKPLPVSVI